MGWGLTLRKAVTRKVYDSVWPIHTWLIKQDVKRLPLGISAFVRSKDEEEWIEASLTSVMPLVDEIVVADASTDGTWEHIQRFVAAHSRVVEIKAVHIAADGTPSFLHRWRLPLPTELHAVQSNLI